MIGDWIRLSQFDGRFDRFERRFDRMFPGRNQYDRRFDRMSPRRHQIQGAKES